jgi:hypothetical protein
MKEVMLILLPLLRQQGQGGGVESQGDRLGPADPPAGTADVDAAASTGLDEVLTAAVLPALAVEGPGQVRTALTAWLEIRGEMCYHDKRSRKTLNFVELLDLGRRCQDT